MSELIWQGLTISVMGMGLTFVALGMLIMIIVLLDRFLPGSNQPPPPTASESEEKSAISTLAQNGVEEEIVAAIAVAVAHLRSLDDLGSTLELGRGAWWLRGQTQLYSPNVFKTIQRRNQL